jgi:hypothetical protein
MELKISFAYIGLDGRMVCYIKAGVAQKVAKEALHS